MKKKYTTKPPKSFEEFGDEQPIWGINSLMVYEVLQPDALASGILDANGDMIYYEYSKPPMGFIPGGFPLDEEDAG